MKKIKVKVGDAEYEVGIEELGNNELKITFGEEEHIVKISEEASAEKKGKGASEKDKTIKAPMPGIISDISVKVGDQVEKGDTLITLLAMKMENSITAPMAGKVKEIKVKANDVVEAGQELVILE
jgi:biotin carboxyl carrier protein